MDQAAWAAEAVYAGDAQACEAHALVAQDDPAYRNPQRLALKADESRSALISLI